MAALGVDAAALRSTLYGAFGTREVSTIYAPQATYKVIMELAEDKRLDENDLARIYVRSADGGLVPLGAFAEVRRGSGPVTIVHKAQLPAITFSFELAEGKSLSDAAAAIAAARTAIGMPVTVFGGFDGQAALYQQSQSAQIWLVAIAVAVIYLVLGMLYENWIHPITILMGIPSAAVGALLALCGSSGSGPAAGACPCRSPPPSGAAGAVTSRTWQARRIRARFAPSLRSGNASCATP